MEITAVSHFIQDPDNFWIIFALAIFLIFDGLVLGYLVKKGFIQSPLAKQQKTNFTKTLLTLSSFMTAIAGVLLLIWIFFLQ